MTWDQIKQWLRDHIPWFLLWALNGLLALVDAVRDAWNFMRDTISNAWGWFLYFRTTDWNVWLVTLLNAWGNWLSARLGAFNSWLVSRLNDWGWWLYWRLTQFNTWLVSLLNSWGNWLADKLWRFNIWLVTRLNEWGNWLADKLWRFNTWLVDRLNSWGAWLADKLNRFNTWLVDRLNSWGNWLADRLSGFNTWLVDRLNDWGTWLEDRHQELIDFLYGEEGVVTGEINKLKAWVTGFLLGFQHLLTDGLVRLVILLCPVESTGSPPLYEYTDLDTFIESMRWWLEGDGAKQRYGYDEIVRWTTEEVLKEKGLPHGL